MDILSVEKARTELLKFLDTIPSRRIRLKKISEFFKLLAENNSQNFFESYLIEFIPQYIDHLKGYSPFGVTPDFTQNIVEVNEAILNLNELTEFKEQLFHLNERMKFKLQLLIKILDGKEIPQKDPKFLFPVIEESEGIDESFVLGAIDSISIKISKTKEEDKFIVVPSESERDKNLDKQIRISWLKAKEFCKKYIRKISNHHEVIISFDEHLGVYKGESVGTALVIGFMEELVRSYNSQTILKPIIGAAFTGGMNERGELNQISKEIIEKKINIAFYSICKTLCVPKKDEQFALENLAELQKIYPKRYLKIVGVNDVDEILLRRDLVDINKQKLVVRTGKFVINNWAGVLFAVLLTAILTSFFALDLDDNPASLTTDGRTLFIKNKNGKILWTKKVELPTAAIHNRYVLDHYCRIYDINEDGRKEVIITGTAIVNDQNNRDSKGLICFSKEGAVIWAYSFTDVVASEREIMNPYYDLNIIDTLTFAENKNLYLFSGNLDSFSSAIIRIDLRTGQRLSGTLWCSGRIVDALIKDLDNNDKADILTIGVDNGFEEIVIFSYETDTLTTVRLSTKEYTIKDYPLAQLKTYIRLAKTDYDNYVRRRISGVDPGSFREDISRRIYTFATVPPEDEKPAHIWIKLDYNLKDIDIVVDNQYRVFRDSLVAHGKLNLPYTDTKEYFDIYKNKILYWKNGKWIKRNEID